MAPKRNRFRHLENPIDLNQKLMDKILKLGDTVVDATCGNGYDSIFIAERIGKGGTLHCFDIQEDAIKNTKESLLKLNNAPTFFMHHHSHENMEALIATKVDCVIYNLGYLPTSDKTIITRPDSTIKSLIFSFSILKPNGVISIMCYLEHDNHNEYEQIKKFLLTLNPLEYSVAETHFILRKKSPVLLLIEKL